MRKKVAPSDTHGLYHEPHQTIRLNSMIKKSRSQGTYEMNTLTITFNDRRALHLQ